MNNNEDYDTSLWRHVAYIILYFQHILLHLIESLMQYAQYSLSQGRNFSKFRAPFQKLSRMWLPDNCLVY
jgi:hypothetical protein